MGIQVFGDLLRGLAGRILTEDAAYNGGFFRIDGPVTTITVVTRSNTISIGETAGNLAFPDAP